MSGLPDLLRVAQGLAAVMRAQTAELAHLRILHNTLLRAVVMPRTHKPDTTDKHTSEPPSTSPRSPSDDTTDPPEPPPQSPPSPPSPSSSPPPPPPSKSASTSAPQSTPSKPDASTPPNPPPNFQMRERRVPESPVSRVLAFGNLGLQLAAGAAAETARRAVGFSSPPPSQSASAFLTDANAQRLAASLSRMRGAALKLGQMLSIQDENVIPPVLINALERVRQGADFMPAGQLQTVMEREFGHDWRAKLGIVSFSDKPIAAASIGQVHRATIDKDGQRKDIVMKIQYPGVARSITSDLNNLKRLVTVGNFVPDSFFLDEALAAAGEELKRECDYEVEAKNQAKYRELIQSSSLSDQFYVPYVYEDLSTKHVLISEYVAGIPVDRVATASKSLRDRVATDLLRLTLSELFVFGFQQSDPNFSNYLYDEDMDRINLVDFGAARAYDEEFLMSYLALIRTCAVRDRKAVIDRSISLGFLTGEESKEMLTAHVEASFAVGEPFHKDNAGGYDFTTNNIPARTAKFGKVMLQYRLTPPPKEAYSLHRRLSGAFLMSMRLRATINAADMLDETVDMLRENGRISE